MRRHYSIEENKIDDDLQWSINRRKWLQLALLGGIALSSPWITSCNPETDEKAPNLDGGDVFMNEEMKNIYALQNFLLPEHSKGPSAAEMNAHQYFVWSLSDQYLPSSDKDYFVSKTIQFFELCKEQTTKHFHRLSETEQENFILKNISESWFENYLAKMITVIFEATLLDPIYGGNVNEEGWKWLDHIPGSPRPNAETKYPEILSKLKPNLT